MKRFIALLLASSILVSLVACTGGSASDGSPDTPEAAGQSSDAAIGEIDRAISFGLVPEEIQGDYATGITFRQYSEMLTNLIRAWDESRLEEWDDIISLAAGSDEEMLREDGILATAYAMVLMGENEPSGFFLLDPDLIMNQMDSNGDTPSWNYPLFPTWEEIGFPWCNSNYMWGGISICAIMLSRVSGQAIYPYDFEGKSAHLQVPLTREDAICAVLRLAETDPAILEPEGTYVQLSDVRTYDKSIITDELLNAESDLPEVTQAQLPSQWKGAGLSSNKNEGSGAGYNDFRETDIKLVADSGFNFTRIFLSFSFLRFPDYPEDGRLVNENELRDLDQLIAWGIKYGVHIQISGSFYLDEGGNAKTDGSIASNDAQWAIMKDYWTMLARRYEGIPSKYLSFDLANETEPGEGDDFSYAKDKLGEMVSSVRAADPQRVLLYSFSGNPGADWVEAAASLGLAIGCHPYYPQYIATTGYEYAELNPYACPSWPQPWFPMGNVQDGLVPLIIQGDLSGAELSFHVYDGTEGSEVSVCADGAPVETIALSGGVPAEDGVFNYPEQLYTFTLPQGTVEVEIQVSEGGYARIDTILVNGSMGEVVMVPHDAADFPDYSDPLPLIVLDDGSYTNSEDRMIDGMEIYRVDVKPYQDIAAQYGVGFMVNEFGIFGSNVYWDIGIVAAYHDEVLQMLTEQNIGWCYCELYSTVPKFLVLMPVLEGEDFQWSNTTKEALTVTCDSGAKWEYWINKELMDVFKKYTMQ